MPVHDVSLPLPGDIRIERGSLRVYVPLSSMLILSAILSLIFAVLRRLK
jgi:hypothetical protein